MTYKFLNKRMPLRSPPKPPSSPPHSGTARGPGRLGVFVCEEPPQRPEPGQLPLGPEGVPPHPPEGLPPGAAVRGPPRRPRLGPGPLQGHADGGAQAHR